MGNLKVISLKEKCWTHDKEDNNNNLLILLCRIFNANPLCRHRIQIGIAMGQKEVGKYLKFHSDSSFQLYKAFMHIYTFQI